jgi:hypothetical protein
MKYLYGITKPEFQRCVFIKVPYEQGIQNNMYIQCSSFEEALFYYKQNIRKISFFTKPEYIHQNISDEEKAIVLDVYNTYKDLL